MFFIYFLFLALLHDDGNSALGFDKIRVSYNLVLIDQDEYTTDAYFNLENDSNNTLILKIVNVECSKCNSNDTFINGQSNVSMRISTSYPSYYISIWNAANGQILCDQYAKNAFEFGENGVYSLSPLANSTSPCLIVNNIRPSSTYLPLAITCSVVIVAPLVYTLLVYFHRRYHTSYKSHQ
jgi:hypothetical protein